MNMPLASIPKDKIVWMDTHYCKHHHKYIEHRQCYRELNGGEERIGFIDIETTNLKGDWGFITCWCILDSKTEKILYDRIGKADVEKYGSSGKEDTRILRSLVKAMEPFDRFVGHYSSRFDLPDIRTRAVICGVRYPTYGAYFQTDTWNILRHKFNLSRNSLENACRQLYGRTEKDHLSGKLINQCIRGNETALRYTLNHCKKDVRDTKRLYDLISSFTRLTKTSI